MVDREETLTAPNTGTYRLYHTHVEHIPNMQGRPSTRGSISHRDYLCLLGASKTEFVLAVEMLSRPDVYTWDDVLEFIEILRSI